MVEISLIVDEKNTLSTFTKLLQSKGYRVSKKHLLENCHIKIKDDLVVIDLKYTKSLRSLEKLNFDPNSIVVLISPVPQKLIKFSDLLQGVTSFYLTKPIDISHFEKVLKSSIEQIDKNKFLKTKERVLIKSVDDSPIAMAAYNLDGDLLYANDPYLSVNKIVKIDKIGFDDLKNGEIVFKDIIYNLKIQQIYITKQRKANRRYRSIFYLTGDLYNIVHLLMDETEDIHYLETLKKTAQFFEQSNEGVMITDSQGAIISTNNSFCSITGYTKEEAIGKSTKLLQSGMHEKSFYENMWDSLKHYGNWQGEIWNKRKNGEVYPEWLSISKLVDPETKELNYMAIFTDITSVKEADKKLHFYANHDHLTGLLNKVQFENMLNQTISSAVRNKKKFALLFIDLDYFKDVNDTAGHNVGDLVLKELASRFRQILRDEDIISRIGGDEFTVIIDNIAQESDAILLANKLNEAIHIPFVYDGKSFYLSLSIGIAMFPTHGLNGPDLSKNADSAMYEVKKGGRNGVLLYNKSFTDNLMEKVSLHRDIKKAIKKEEFELYYQLVVDIQNQQIVGAEALIRWNHKKRGFVSPEEFIRVAEHHGLIAQIGEFVLKKSCEALPLFLQKFGNDFILSVNVSSKEFAEENYVSNFLEIVNDFQVVPKNLELEITETYIMKNHTVAIEKMKQLREKGFNIAIDDFGTGYSSLSYLKKFPINKIKIDKSFVMDIDIDQDDKEMVNAIINIAKIFHLKVQAEGVERLKHVDILKEQGADIAQGYHYSKPIPLGDIITKEWSLKSGK